jgi:EmrB/QacA subfamily drug resistance transporter
MHKPSTAYVVSVWASAVFMELFDSTVILTALPAIAASFGVSPLAVGIGITGYLLALAAVLPACGWIADRFGTRRVFLFAITFFSLASIACGMSRSLAMFTVARVVQGVAGALMSPVARIAVLKVLDRHKVMQAMNIGIMAGLMGPTIAPPIGGFIATYWSWRWIFFINVPIAILGLVAAWGRYPNLRAAGPRPFDWRGAALNALAMVGVIYGLQLLTGGRHDWGNGAAIALGGAIFCVLALRHARVFPHPLLSLASLHIPSFRVSALAGFVTRIAVFSPMFVLPLLLQLGLGMNAFVAGVYILVAAGADVLMKLWVVGSLRRHGHRRILVWTATLYPLFPLGLIALTQRTPAVVIVLLLIYGGAVRSYHMTALSTLSFADVPQQEMSDASALIAVAQQVAQAISVALAAVAINFVVAWRGTLGAPLGRGDFVAALLLSAACAWAALLWYRAMPVTAGSRASGYQPHAETGA